MGSTRGRGGGRGGGWAAPCSYNRRQISHHNHQLVANLIGREVTENNLCEPIGHKRRIKTEEKAKIVAAGWGTELIQFLAAQAILHQDL